MLIYWVDFQQIFKKTRHCLVVFAYLKLSQRLSATYIHYRMGLAVSGNPIEFMQIIREIFHKICYEKLF